MDKLDLEPIDNQPLDLEPLDLEPIEPPKEVPSTASDFLTGTGQGLTFGFLDELISAAKTPELYKAFWGLPSKEGIAKDTQEAVEKYRAQQQIEQEKVKEAKERSPIAFGTGEIAGGLLPALFTGGGAATTAAAKGLLPTIGKGVLAGAKYGTLAAAGTAESTVEDFPELAKEIAGGTLAGGALGGAFSGVASAGKGLVSLAKESELGRQMAAQYAEMKKPESLLFGAPAKLAQIDREKEEAREIAKRFLEAESIQGKKISSTLKKAKDVLIEVEDNAIDDVLSQLEKDPANFKAKDKIKVFGIKQYNPETQEYETVQEGLLDLLKTGSISPEEANDLRKILNRNILANRQDKSGNPALANTLENLSSNIFESLKKNVKGFEQANKEFDLLRSATTETILGKGVYAREVPVSKKPDAPVIRSTEKFFSDVKKGKATKLEGEIRDILERLTLPGMAQRDKIAAINQLEENLKLLKEYRPKLLERVKLDPEEIISKIKYEADVSAGVSGRFGYEPQAGFIRSFLNLITPRGAGLTGAAGLGKMVGTVGRSAPAKLASKIYSAAEPELRKVSERLLADPLTKRFGENLASSLDKPGGVARRAVLFSIMQSPEARKILSELYPGVGED